MGAARAGEPQPATGGAPRGASCRLLPVPPANLGNSSAVGPMGDLERGVRRSPDALNLDEDFWENYSLCEWILIILMHIVVLLTFPITIWMCIEVVMQYQRLVIFRLGHIRKGGSKGPGIYFILPCLDHAVTVDMRTISFDIAPQEILTKDSVTVMVDGVVYYRVWNAILSVTNVLYMDPATRLLAQTTLRNVLGTKDLSQILSDREEIAQSMQITLDKATDGWGIKVELVEIKDVKLPQQLHRAMAAEAEASRDARAKVIAAEGEMNASKALQKAAAIICENPAALQLRYLQTLTTIAAEKNSTIIFPVPLDILQGLISPKQEPK